MIKIIFISISTVLGALCLYFFISMYWLQKFNTERNSLLSEEGVNYSDNSFVWAIFAVILFIPLIVAMIRQFTFQARAIDKVKE